MRWQGGGRSSNVEDRRGMRPGLVGGGLGAVVLALVGMFLGVDLGPIAGGGGAPPEAPAGAPPAEDEKAQFVATVLGSTEETWNGIFAQNGQDYPEPTLVLFTGAVQSACGFAQAAVGPFYCPTDGKVYIDLQFYEDLRSQLGAPGDFAQAYVIAHEVGHHVQNLTGVSDQVHQARQRMSEAEGNAMSVRLELQADCYAGVWGNHSQRQRQWLETGDVEEALNAASAIGDDRLQKQAQGQVVPESFTHGSSAQRVRWFQRGFQSGDPAQCNTFDAATL
ncbi:MAG TPA: neutral zinc metallopeptidase [Longimicrobium sp.]|nr:neutral zinc metallopeptidase [Longimicrobium sp.]